MRVCGWLDESGGWQQALSDYFILLKPKITLLIVVTAFTGVWLASDGVPDPGVTLATLLGAGAAAGAGGVFNHYFDRDLDARMLRTRDRPLPSGRIRPGRALLFGVGLLVFSLLWLYVQVNALAAMLALTGFTIYVGVYTIWLKRRTPLNIVIGGAAGAIPPMIGGAAVSGGVELPAVLLFLIVFLWTPPHFWALALARRHDYAAAGIPMLPVVAGAERTRREIMRYTLALVGVTLLLVPVGGAGPVYLVSALALGAGFVVLARGLGRDRGGRAALHLFAYSTVYLALLFTALALDRVV